MELAFSGLLQQNNSIIQYFYIFKTGDILSFLFYYRETQRLRIFFSSYFKTIQKILFDGEDDLLNKHYFFFFID